MVLGDNDRDIFLNANTAVDVVYKGVIVKAIKDEFEERVNEGQMDTAAIARVIGLTFHTADVVGMVGDDIVLINGTSYSVRQRRAIHEGKYTHVMLSL